MFGNYLHQSLLLSVSMDNSKSQSKSQLKLKSKSPFVNYQFQWITSKSSLWALSHGFSEQRSLLSIISSHHKSHHHISHHTFVYFAFVGQHSGCRVWVCVCVCVCVCVISSPRLQITFKQGLFAVSLKALFPIRHPVTHAHRNTEKPCFCFHKHMIHTFLSN